MKLFVNIVIIFLACLSSGAEGAEVSIQADDYIAYNDIYGVNIQGSSGYLLGLDYSGEWTEYNYSISSLGTRSARIFARGEDAIFYHLRLTLTPVEKGEITTVDFEFTGSGVG